MILLAIDLKPKFDYDYAKKPFRITYIRIVIKNHHDEWTISLIDNYRSNVQDLPRYESVL